MENPSILILTPFRNEDHSIPLYLKGLKAIKYPTNLIDVFWLENDSSDKTLQMLQKAHPSVKGFKSVNLKSIKILTKPDAPGHDFLKRKNLLVGGGIKKHRPGGYFKDIGYNWLRKHPWKVIWNKHFLPLVRKSKADYVLCWYADAVPPPNVITECLKVFKLKPDAGWVGGTIYRRYPKHHFKFMNWVKGKVKSKTIRKVGLTGHVWMNPRAALAKCHFRDRSADMHHSLADGLKDQGLKVYYQPSIFIKHISTDGKIHRNKPEWK